MDQNTITGGTYLDEEATVEKVLLGQIPDGTMPNDNVTIISDYVARIYVNILAKVIMGTIPDATPAELIEQRVKLFDDIVDIINTTRIGRLHKLINKLTICVNESNATSSCWPNTKMKNNVTSFIIDFFIWTPEQRHEFLVVRTEEELNGVYDTVAPGAETGVN